MVPMALVLILFGREILSLFGAEFRAGYETLIILTLGQLLNAFTGPVGFLMIMTGNQRIATAVEAVSTTIQIGLVIALLPGWGIEGAAVGMATATVVRNVAMFAYAWQRTGIRSSII